MLYKYKKLIFLIFLFLTIKTTLISQTNDMNLWISFTIDKEITKDIDCSLEQGFRLDENCSQIYNIYTELSAEYDIFDFIEIGATYRFIMAAGDANEFNRNYQLKFDITAKYEISRFELSYKARYQQKKLEYFEDDWSQIPRRHFRNRFSIEYDIRKTSVTPYVSYEFYYAIRQPDRPPVDEKRVKAGFSYKIAKNHHIDMNFMYLNEFRKNSNYRGYVIGIDYKFDWDRKKKKRKTETGN